MKILLDAGHYGKYNQSPCNSKYFESEFTWKFHLLLKRSLEKYGFEVGITRERQVVDKGVYERGLMAKGYDLMLSIHSNAIGNVCNNAIDYPLVIMPIESTLSDKLPLKLTTAISNSMATRQSGQVSVKTGNNGDYYGVIRGAWVNKVPCYIIEHSFHTNSNSVDWLLNEQNITMLADEEAHIIADYYNVGVIMPNESKNHWAEPFYNYLVKNKILLGDETSNIWQDYEASMSTIKVGHFITFMAKLHQTLKGS